MNESAIAARLLILFASGGTLERTVADLPMFKTQIESALDRLETAGRCSATGIAERAARLRELVQRKDQAIRRDDFDVAAAMRADECALFESLGLGRPTGTHAILAVNLDKQIQDLSAWLRDANAA